MITKNDLQAAIAECQGTRNPNASTCLKLASYYVIQDKMFPEHQERGYSYTSAPEIKKPEYNIIDYPGNSEFLEAIQGRNISDIIPIIDELMSTLLVTSPRLYAGVIAKINS